MQINWGKNDSAAKNDKKWQNCHEKLQNRMVLSGFGDVAKTQTQLRLRFRLRELTVSLYTRLLKV